MIGFRVDFDDLKTRQIVYGNLYESCDCSPVCVEAVCDDIQIKKAGLWRVENGWIVLSVIDFKGERFLFVHCVEGRLLTNGDGFAFLFEIALLEGCNGVMCETKKRGMKRLLERFGFRKHEQAYIKEYVDACGLIPMFIRFNGKK